MLKDYHVKEKHIYSGFNYEGIQRYVAYYPCRSIHVFTLHNNYHIPGPSSSNRTRNSSHSWWSLTVRIIRNYIESFVKSIIMTDINNTAAACMFPPFLLIAPYTMQPVGWIATLTLQLNFTCCFTFIRIKNAYRNRHGRLRVDVPVCGQLTNSVEIYSIHHILHLRFTQPPVSNQLSCRENCGFCGWSISSLKSQQLTAHFSAFSIANCNAIAIS